MASAQTIKSLIKTRLPRLWKPTSQAWHQYHQRRYQAQVARITKAFVARHGWKVAGGPFSGMNYVDTAVCSTLLPKLAGSYETELHPTIDVLDARDYDAVLDVGCAEGYYAIGFARKWSHVQVRAYDIDAQARQLCERMAALNGVEERVQVEGGCDTNTLNTMNLRRTLLVSDCEGYELELLQPESVPGLKRCDIIVELHDCLGLNVTPVLRERFAATHEITLISSTPRDAKVYPVLAFLPAMDRVLAVDEIRPPMQWGFLKARTTLHG